MSNPILSALCGEKGKPKPGLQKPIFIFTFKPWLFKGGFFPKFRTMFPCGKLLTWVQKSVFLLLRELLVTVSPW